MNALLLNLLTFFLGLLLGNWLAIGRDRRREFNEAVLPIRKWLLTDVDSPSPYTQWPSAIEIDTFTACLPAWKRSGFRKAIERHRAAHENQSRNESGSVRYADVDAVKAALRECMRYTGRK